MKAVIGNIVLAEAPKKELIYIEGNWYFPPSSVNFDYMQKSDTPYTCPWKGQCQYYDVMIEGQASEDNAWTYPQPLPSAIERLHKDFSGYVAFWREVRVEESDLDAKPEQLVAA